VLLNMVEVLMMERLQQIIDALTELGSDNTVPRNVKNQLTRAITVINSDEEHRIKVSKALEEIDEVIDDPNLQPYTRTQLWNIVSLLEAV